MHVCYCCWLCAVRPNRAEAKHGVTACASRRSCCLCVPDCAKDCDAAAAAAAGCVQLHQVEAEAKHDVKARAGRRMLLLNQGIILLLAISCLLAALDNALKISGLSAAHSSGSSPADGDLAYAAGSSSSDGHNDDFANGFGAEASQSAH